MSDAMLVFDRRAVRLHRDRAAPNFAHHDFLMREAAERLAERLADCRREFACALDLGCHGGLLAPMLGRQVARLVQSDLSAAMLRRARGARVVADEELLPFAPASFDLVLSGMSLHWVNDLPGALLQIRQVLKPDGLFLGCMAGGATLAELRQALIEAEAEIENGASLRVSPFADLQSLAGLLQRAGFALPVADQETITVTYPDALALMRELRGMGETHAAHARRKGLSRRATLARAAERYATRFTEADGRIRATFQLLFMTGWHPHESQPRPLRPGSASTKLADALGAEEKSAGEKAGPGGA
ncbi:MAG: methyltransferase domain-containing protein [Alphaproteobacteria bacterium]|nr:methyltransferase domain-containing protein [Alphaproteobacteria bacterium]